MVGVLAYLVRVCLSTAIVGAQGMGAELVGVCKIMGLF